MDALGNPIALALTPGQTHDLVEEALHEIALFVQRICAVSAAARFDRGTACDCDRITHEYCDSKALSFGLVFPVSDTESWLGGRSIP